MDTKQLIQQLDKYLDHLQSLKQHSNYSPYSQYDEDYIAPTPYQTISVGPDFYFLLKHCRDELAGDKTYQESQWLKDQYFASPPPLTSHIDESKVAEDLRTIIKDNDGFMLITAIDEYVTELEKKNFKPTVKKTVKAFVQSIEEMDEAGTGSIITHKIGTHYVKLDTAKWQTVSGGTEYFSDNFSSGIIKQSFSWVEKKSATTGSNTLKAVVNKVKSLQEMNEAEPGSSVSIGSGKYNKIKTGSWKNTATNDVYPSSDFNSGIQGEQVIWVLKILKTSPYVVGEGGTSSGGAIKAHSLKAVPLSALADSYTVQNPNCQKPYVFKVGDFITAKVHLEYLPKGTVVTFKDEYNYKKMTHAVDSPWLDEKSQVTLTMKAIKSSSWSGYKIKSLPSSGNLKFMDDVAPLVKFYPSDDEFKTLSANWSLYNNVIIDNPNKFILNTDLS